MLFRRVRSRSLFLFSSSRGLSSSSFSMVFFSLSFSLFPCFSVAQFPTLCGRCDTRWRLLVAQHVCVPVTERPARIHADDAPLAVPLSASNHHFSPPPSRGARLPRESLREIARLNVKHERSVLCIHGYVAYVYFYGSISTQSNDAEFNFVF